MSKRLVGVFATYGFAALAIWLGLSFTKGNGPLALGDPGELVRWAQPIMQSVKNLSMAMAVGSLVFAAWAFSEKSEALTRSLQRASFASIAWTIAGASHLLLTYLWVTGSELSGGTSFGAGLWQFATEIELGQSLVMSLVFAAITSFIALLSSSLRSTLFAAVFALAGLVPLALLAANGAELDSYCTLAWSKAHDDISKHRVIVDQVACLTDQSAINLHYQLVGSKLGKN